MWASDDRAECAAEQAGPRWSLARRVLFRFAFIYLGLYYLPFPLNAASILDELPKPFHQIGEGAGSLAKAWETGLEKAAVWVGPHVLGLGPGAVVIQPTGSGDTMAAYVEAFTFLALAVLGTVAWSIAGRRRRAHPRLEGVFHVYLRFALAAILLSYGFAKVPPRQFVEPGPDLLVQTYGDSSPMGLLWRFMGFSPAYTMFAGIAEIVPGVLLFFRRTAVIGALIGAAALLNVVMMNFCYDVPVKLYSGHLLLTAIVILVPALPGLVDVFLLNRAAPPRALWTPFRRRWLNWTIGGVKLLFVVLLLGGQVRGAWKAWSARFGPGASRPALQGVYEVESFALNGEARPPLLTNTTQWRRFMVSRWGGGIVQHMSGPDSRFLLTHDEKAGTVRLQSRSGESFTLTCTKPAEGRLVLEGPFRDGRVRVELRKAEDRSFPLTTRGFHWIQEFPYNR